MYISGNQDVHTSIMLDLPLVDLKHFCATDTFTRHYCQTNEQLRRKFTILNKVVKDLLEKVALGKSIWLKPTGYIDGKMLLKFMHFHDINYNTYQDNQVEGIIMFNYNFTIRYHDRTKQNLSVTKKQQSDFLFHILYDRLVEVFVAIFTV